MVWHWSVDIKKFQKEHPQEFKIWKIVQSINYGLEEGEKLNEKEVKKSWSIIKPQLDPHKSVYLEFILWNKKPSSRQYRENFWNLS